jgi:hypothetical protein
MGRMYYSALSSGLNYDLLVTGAGMESFRTSSYDQHLVIKKTYKHPIYIYICLICFATNFNKNRAKNLVNGIMKK